MTMFYTFNKEFDTSVMHCMVSDCTYLILLIIDIQLVFISVYSCVKLILRTVKIDCLRDGNKYEKRYCICCCKRIIFICASIVCKTRKVPTLQKIVQHYKQRSFPLTVTKRERGRNGRCSCQERMHYPIYQENCSEIYLNNFSNTYRLIQQLMESSVEYQNKRHKRITPALSDDLSFILVQINMFLLKSEAHSILGSELNLTSIIKKSQP